MLNKNEVKVGEAVEAIMKRYGLYEKYRASRAVEIWENAMGKFIATKTEDVKITGNKLHVRLSSAALRNELKYDKANILNLVNKEIGEEIITELIIS